jgi:hypothetical protein
VQEAVLRRPHSRMRLSVEIDPVLAVLSKANSVDWPERLASAADFLSQGSSFRFELAGHSHRTKLVNSFLERRIHSEWTPVYEQQWPSSASRVWTGELLSPHRRRRIIMSAANRTIASMWMKVDCSDMDAGHSVVIEASQSSWFPRKRRLAQRRCAGSAGAAVGAARVFQGEASVAHFGAETVIRWRICG